MASKGGPRQLPRSNAPDSGLGLAPQSAGPEETTTSPRPYPAPDAATPIGTGAGPVRRMSCLLEETVPGHVRGATESRAGKPGSVRIPVQELAAGGHLVPVPGLSGVLHRGR